MRGARLFKSTVALTVALILTLGGYAAPARAMSTSTEVAEGRAESAEIDAQSLVIHDPFLTSWVNTIGSNLAANRKRRDIQFQFIILGDPDINAFALKGGYIHVNMGLLNFVSSDDELAATMGHEMGHVELRHVVKGDNTSTILGILTAIASMLSPVAYALGSLGGELASDKYSRIDELQADHYGLQLMADAGYDPQAAIDVMDKLGALDPGPDSKADKAFIDHPVPQDRVAHLEGYPQLDGPSGTALTAQAIHDQEEGRYSYSNAKFREAAKLSPSPIITQHEQQLNYALRESGALAAPDPRVEYSLATPNDPHRVAAAQALIAAQKAARTALDSAKVDARTGNVELGDLEHHIDQLAPVLEGQGGEGAGPAPTNSAGISQSNPTAHLIRDISGMVDLAGDVLSTAPTLIGPNEDALRDMAYPLTEEGPLTPKSQALLQFYPSMTTGLANSTQQLLDSIALSRDAITKANQAVQISANTLAPDPNATPMQVHGEMRLPPRNFSSAINAWDAALAEAQHASDEMYAAQTMGLSAQITLLDVLSSPDRYNDFREALISRFPGQTPPTYSQASSSGIAPGEIACASWLSYETKTSVTAVMAQMRVMNQSCEQIALNRGLLAESMEIAEGLVYEDYVDLPSRPPTTTTAKTTQ